jgi:hypothetical protein
VTWTKLLGSGDVQKHKTSKKELDDMREVIERDLADAAVLGLSADRRFATAYNAALQAASMAIACAGYRVTARIGHHMVAIECAKLHEYCMKWMVELVGLEPTTSSLRTMRSPN